MTSETLGERSGCCKPVPSPPLPCLPHDGGTPPPLAQEGLCRQGLWAPVKSQPPGRSPPPSGRTERGTSVQADGSPSAWGFYRLQFPGWSCRLRLCYLREVTSPPLKLSFLVCEMGILNVAIHAPSHAHPPGYKIR